MNTKKTMRLFKKKPIPTLRSCPFCGGKPRLARCGDQKEFWVVQCSECYQTPVDWGEAKVDIVRAIKTYNERADFASIIISTYNFARSVLTKATSSEDDK